MSRSRTVTFRAGERLAVDLRVSDPSDRARVMYVPTPDDIAAEMVWLAAVNANDVVYEPGSGDARVTIAAVRGGAKLGVGIDIDAIRRPRSSHSSSGPGPASGAVEMRDGWAACLLVSECDERIDSRGPG